MKLFLLSLLSSTAVTLIMPIGLVLDVISKKFNWHWYQRLTTHRRIATNLLKNKKTSKSILILCSSAGELEQALPIISRLRAKDYDVYCLIFSSSGIKFANLEKRDFYYDYAPPDLIWAWRKIFHVISPEASICIRHELWPGFAWVASRMSRLFMANVTCAKESVRPARKMIYDATLNSAQKIFVATQNDLESLLRLYDLNPQKLIVAGDTKFDRVVERRETRKHRVTELQGQLKLWKQNSRLLVVGSGYSQELKIICDVLKTAKIPTSWKVIFAPHYIDDNSVCTLKALTQQLEIPTQVWSKSQTIDPTTTLIIFDKMGSLGELYGCAHAAFVGGALHNKVHNVLEPAAYGLSLASGPRFLNSREAVELHSEKLLTIVQTPQDLTDFLQKHDDANKSTKDFVEQKAHASGIILEQILNQTPLESNQ